MDRVHEVNWNGKYYCDRLFLGSLGNNPKGSTEKRCVVLNTSETSIPFLMKIAPPFPKKAIAAPHPKCDRIWQLERQIEIWETLIEKLQGTDTE
jgi:hypothetical protein